MSHYVVKLDTYNDCHVSGFEEIIGPFATREAQYDFVRQANALGLVGTNYRAISPPKAPEREVEWLNQLGAGKEIKL